MLGEDGGVLGAGLVSDLSGGGRIGRRGERLIRHKRAAGEAIDAVAVLDYAEGDIAGEFVQLERL